MGFYDVIPASLQEIVQNGLLVGAFEEGLVPSFLFNMLADERPWGSQIGSEGIFTKAGLMTPNTTPTTGNDASPSTYGVEQYRVRMDQFTGSIDTNMAVSRMALASKFLEDNNRLGIMAAQSLDLLARNAIYGAYGEGTTWATSDGSTVTALVVHDASGFQFVVADLSTSGSNPGTGLTANATPNAVAVSGSNPLAIVIGASTAASVTGVDLDTNTLTLAVAKSWSNGDAVVAANAPVQLRPNARLSANQLVAGDIATLALFRSGVTRLRRQVVPTIRGAYTAHVPPETINELFSDAEFQSAYRGRGDSPAYTNFTMGDTVGDATFHGRFAGIDWFENPVAESGVNEGSLTFYRPVIAGADCLIRAPFSDMGDLVSQQKAGGVIQVEMINGVARILRAPLDRLGQVLTSTYSWIGGYSVPTDVLAASGDPAIYKRAVVLEHV